MVWNTHRKKIRISGLKSPGDLILDNYGIFMTPAWMRSVQPIYSLTFIIVNCKIALKKLIQAEKTEVGTKYFILTLQMEAEAETLNNLHKFTQEVCGKEESNLTVCPSPELYPQRLSAVFMFMHALFHILLLVFPAVHLASITANQSCPKSSFAAFS